MKGIQLNNLVNSIYKTKDNKIPKIPSISKNLKTIEKGHPARNSIDSTMNMTKHKGDKSVNVEVVYTLCDMIINFLHDKITQEVLVFYLI